MITELPGDDMRPEGATPLTSLGTRELPGRGGVEAQPRPGLFSWTDERLKTLRALWKDGLSVNEIGRRMGISKNSVVGKVHRLKLPGRPSPLPKKKPPENIFARQEFTGCLFMHGNPSDIDWTFCQKDRYIRPNGIESSYCPEHHTLCTLPRSHERGEPFHIGAFENKPRAA